MEILFTNISNIGNALGWTLIHFLWQGLLIFISYWIITRLFLKNKINQQYWVGLFFILMCLILPIRELVIQLQMIDNNTNIVQLISNNISSQYSSGILNPLDLTVLLIQKFIPYLVAFWMLSVFLISGHLFQSWIALLKLSKQPSIKLPKSLLNKLQVVSKELKLKISPLITISEKIDIPATFGFFKPVILLPFSLITKLPQEQMEAILVHELCHIKRADFLHNIMQLLVETLFFYHPLTKWVSRDIRKIREQCCDEMVLNLKTNPIVYANALTNIASIYNKHNNNDKSHLQIAANDGELFDRIKFLMLDNRTKSPFTNIVLGITFSLIALLVFNNITSNNNNINVLATTANQNIQIEEPNSINKPQYLTPNIYSLINQQNTKPKPIVINNETARIQVEKPKAVTSKTTKTEKTSPIINKPHAFTSDKEKLIKENKDNEKNISNTSEVVIPEKVIKPNNNNITYPKIIKKFNPIYSRLARSREIEGTVILSFTINKNGRVRKINVDKNSPLKLLDGSAKTALRKWRFDPKSINTSNINHRYQQIFSFSLDDSYQCMSEIIGTRLNSDQICKK